MKYKFTIALVGLLLTACIDSKKQANDSLSSNQTLLESNKKQDSYKDSITSKQKELISLIHKNDLEIYDYPNLTVWGGLSIKSVDGELKVIEAIQNAELGFTKKIYYLQNEKIYRIEYIGHHAVWGKYKENYPSDKFDWNPKKMTYFDTSFVFETKNDTNVEKHNKLILEGKKIIEFIKNEKIEATNN